MPPVDLTVLPDDASPSDNAVELPALENEGDDVPLLFQAPASPAAPPTCNLMPPPPPAPPALPAPPAPLPLPPTPVIEPEPVEIAPTPKPRQNRIRNRPLAPAPASPPLALRRPKRAAQPPRDWWVVQHKPPQSSDEE
ncbi:hypothetical protein DXG01_015882, partial [Tephrocybe rancida]